MILACERLLCYLVRCKRIKSNFSGFYSIKDLSVYLLTLLIKYKIDFALFDSLEYFAYVKALASELDLNLSV